MQKWKITYRLDTEEVFTTESEVIELPTTSISVAARIAEERMSGHNVTIIALERLV